MSVWRIFFEGLKIYCANAHKFLGYMAFPVLGQLLGLGLIFGLTFLYTSKLIFTGIVPQLGKVVITIAMIVLPGVLLWAKAFWDYLVAYGALNSMTEGALTTGRVYDFRAHSQTVTKRFFPFVVLWCLFGVFTLIAFNPLFWIIGFILFVYFVLIFQVFTFENLSPWNCFVRSFKLIKGHFAQTLGLMVILFVFTYWLLPTGVTIVFAAITDFAALLVPWVETLPLDGVYLILQRVNILISPLDIAGFFVNNIITFAAIGFTLPLRSVCWTLWYKVLTEDKHEKKKKQRVEAN